MVLNAVDTLMRIFLSAWHADMNLAILIVIP